MVCHFTFVIFSAVEKHFIVYIYIYQHLIWIFYVDMVLNDSFITFGLCENNLAYYVCGAVFNSLRTTSVFMRCILGGSHPQGHYCIVKSATAPIHMWPQAFNWYRRFYWSKVYIFREFANQMHY